MTDVIDLAQQFEAINTAQSLKVQEAIAANTRRPTSLGHCLNRECEEPFTDQPTRLYCGPACAERHDRQMKQHR